MVCIVQISPRGMTVTYTSEVLPQHLRTAFPNQLLYMCLPFRILRIYTKNWAVGTRGNGVLGLLVDQTSEG